MLYYIAQGVGFIGMLMAFVSFQQNKNKLILKFQVLAALSFTVHFFLLGAYTGAAVNALGASRNFLFYNRDKAWSDKKIWLYAYIVVFAISGILTWKNIFSLLPVLGMILSTIGLWAKKPKITRFVILPSSPCWMIYNIVTGSVAGILTEAFALTSLIIAFIRFDILKQKAEINQITEQ